jgi:hypothetical protein
VNNEPSWYSAIRLGHPLPYEPYAAQRRPNNWVRPAETTPLQAPVPFGAHAVLRVNCAASIAPAVFGAHAALRVTCTASLAPAMGGAQAILRLNMGTPA